MSQESKVEGSANAADSLPSEVTKGSIRKKIWDHIEKNSLATFPRPVYNRIPNFKGSEEAAIKACELDVFKKANTIKINPDKPQQNARFLTLEANKTLLVPTPRLRTGLFNKITPPEDANKETLRVCSTSRGVREHSDPIGLESKVKVDLVILGSVAVSREGFRIGKGEGYADLEYGMMTAMGAVSKDTVVITTVHDCQVVDIPEALMQSNDVCVDYIVTPTEVIKCNNKRPRPPGIIWSMLAPEKLDRCPVLKKLRLMEQKMGKNVCLKDEESAPTVEDLEEAAKKVDEIEDDPRDDDRPRYRRRRYFRRYRRRPRRTSGEEEEEDGEKGSASENEHGDSKKPRPRRRQQRRRRTQSGDEEGAEGGDEAGDGDRKKGRDSRPPRNKRRPRRYQPRRRQRSADGSQDGENAGDSEGRDSGDRENYRSRPRRGQGKTSSVYIGGIPKTLRVSELKAEVRGNKVEPLQVIWRGNNGHAFLVFDTLDQADKALEHLSELSCKDKKLTVQLSKRTQNRRKTGDDDDGDDGGKDSSAAENAAGDD